VALSAELYSQLAYDLLPSRKKWEFAKNTYNKRWQNRSRYTSC